MNGLASGLLNVLKFLEDTMPQSDAKIPISTLSREAWVSITLCLVVDKDFSRILSRLQYKLIRLATIY